jgi:fatty acid desaturase
MSQAATLVARATRVPRIAAWDGVFIALTIGHVLVVAATPPWYVIAAALWWNANTISHNFIHRPFFSAPRANRAFSFVLSLVLGIPQTIWRDRHLRHHAGLGDGVRFSRRAVAETTGVAVLFVAMALGMPEFFVGAYVPGWMAGLGLCWLHGHYEHARGTTSHYGRLYNLLFFNDGYHAEHHAYPTLHWTELARVRGNHPQVSAWPAVLRWLDAVSLTGLERLVLRWPRLQRFVLHRHERAVRTLIRGLPAIARVTVVGGGLFPRSALVVGRVLPHAAVTILDAESRHLEIARAYLPGTVQLVAGRFDAQTRVDADLVIVPLAFQGDRRRLYADPPAPAVLVHDWIWAVRSRGVVVSWLLLKRLNLVTR